MPFPPGGQADIQARAIAQKMTEGFGLAVLVDNRPGGSSIIGTREVAKATPDGHTLLYTIAVFVQLPHLYATPPFDVFREFTPITTGARSGTVLTAHVSMPFSTVPELVVYAKANPGKLNCASFGAGTTSHLNCERLKRQAAIDIVHVPYKGTGDAMRDILSGAAQIFFDGPTTAIANAKGGRIKLVAAATEERIGALPDLPTLREAGYDVGITGYLWFWGRPVCRRPPWTLSTDSSPRSSSIPRWWSSSPRAGPRLRACRRQRRHARRGISTSAGVS